MRGIPSEAPPMTQFDKFKDLVLGCTVVAVSGDDVDLRITFARGLSTESAPIWPFTLQLSGDGAMIRFAKIRTQTEVIVKEVEEGL
jgi:hypothetical protein